MSAPPMRRVKSMRTFLRFIFFLSVGYAANAQTTNPPSPAFQSAHIETRTLADYLHLNRLPNVPKIGLVLSGGGARGFAQIGVLQALERAHIPIHFIVGTSVGALVGGLYASGYSADELDSIARTSDWESILAIGDENSRRELYYDQKLESDRTIVTLPLEVPYIPIQPAIPDAISEGMRLSAYINALVWNALYHAPESFDNLKYPFRAATTDIVSGKLIVFNKGNLAEVLRASASEPLRFAPVNRDSLVLVDGGLVDNIPVEIAKQAGCDIIIVVNSTSPLNARADLSTPWNVADQVVTLMMRRQYTKELAQASFVITPLIGEHKASDFTHVDSLITAGVASAEQAIPAIQDSIRLRGTPSVLSGLPETGGTINSIHIAGMKHLDTLPVHAIVANLIGAQYSAHGCLPVIERVLRLFRRQGYTFAIVEKTEFDASTGELTFTINEGILVSITIEGNTTTNDGVILRELALHTNEPFSTGDAEQTLANLNSTELFRQMSFEAIPSVNGIKADIRVEELSTPWVARLSGKIDNERNTQLGIEIADENLDGRGVEASGMIFGGLRNRTIEFSLSSRRFLSSYISYNLTAYSRERNIYVYADSQAAAGTVDVNTKGEYAQEQNGAEFSLGENVPRFGDLSIIARYEWQSMANLSGEGLNGTDKVATLGGLLRLDTQDKFPFPQSGRFKCTLRIGIWKRSAQTSHLQKCRSPMKRIFRMTISIRSIRNSVGGTRIKRHRRRTNSGLAGNIIFWGYAKTNTWGIRCLPEAWNTATNSRSDWYFDSYLKAEYDLGAVWPKISTIHFGDLRHGAGIGLGLNTPVGIVDVAVGKSFYLANPIQARPFAEFYPTFVYFTIGRGL